MPSEEDDDIVLTGDDLIGYVNKLKRYVRMLEESLADDDDDDEDHDSDKPQSPKSNAEIVASLSRGSNNHKGSSPRSSPPPLQQQQQQQQRQQQRRRQQNSGDKGADDGLPQSPTSSSVSQSLVRRASSARRAKSLRDCTVVIAGLGRIGARVAELLARAGIGRLALIDKGSVEPRHLESSPFGWDHVGLPKTQATRLLLHAINPGLRLLSEIVDVSANIRDSESAILRNADADLMIACLDSEPARRCINDLALELNVPFFNAQLNADVSAGVINLVRPGRTACLRCHAAKEMASSLQSRRTHGTSFAGLNHALRPTKLDIPGVPLFFAGLVAQNAIKFLRMDGIVLPTFKFKLGADTSITSSANVQSGKFSTDEDSTNPSKASSATETEASKEFKSFGAEPFPQCSNEICLRYQHS